MTQELDRAERRRLLGVARGAIRSRLAGEELPAPDADAALRQRCGAFVTLRSGPRGDLRGCIGFIEPLFPLIETVARAAGAAAFHDNRFEPVTAAELAGIRIEISVLSAPQPIQPEDVVVGRHGLIIALGRRKGLLLPQVPLEHGWDRETFLDQTCRKAGLPPGSWRDPDTRLLAFTAEVFDEDEDGEDVSAAE
jgi:AmmeMemoRadiSam system protein A